MPKKNKKGKIKDKSLEWRICRLEDGIKEYTTFKDHVSVRVELGQNAAINIQCHKDNLEDLKAYFAKLIVNLLQISPRPPTTQAQPEDPTKALQRHLSEQADVSNEASGSPIYQ